MVSRTILGIESSCDETSAALVRNGHEVLSNVVASQTIHSDYGGVVPELASREHLRNIVPITREALRQAAVTYADVDAIAVTEGPGLAGALLVGITFAKSLAAALGKPLIAVNHLEGHIHAVLMQHESLGDSPANIPGAPSVVTVSSSPRVGTEAAGTTNEAPLLALVVSGGHTHLYLAHKTGHTWRYRNIGKTVDDAAGEAYDKAAKLLGLPYPGGPWMDALAKHGTADPALFPFTQIKQKATGNIAPKLLRDQPATDNEDPRFDFSFSGIKTAVRRYVETHDLRAAIAAREAAIRAAGLLHAKPSDPAAFAQVLAHFDAETLNLIASFQHAVVKNLTRRTFDAAAHFGARGILISGGVSANSHLRETMRTRAAAAGIPIAFPTLSLSTDNAAMIAAAAWPKLLAGQFAPTTLEPTPQLRLG